MAQTGFTRAYNRFSAISDLKLAEDTGDTILHCFETQTQGVRNRQITLTLRHQVQHVSLPICQFWKSYG